MSASGTIPSRAASIVGVDVGGTFTDLFLYRRGKARSSAQPRSPSDRGDEAVGLPRGPRRSRAACERRGDRPRHHSRHQCAAGAQGRDASASSPRAASATCSRCAAATGRTPGGCGANSCRSPTATCGSRSPSARWPTARSAPPSTPTRCARRPRRSSREAPRRSPSSSSTPTPIRRTSAARPRPRGRVWPNEHVATSQRDPAGDPRIRAHLDDGAQRLSPARRRLAIWASSRLRLSEGGFEGEFHIVQSNGGVMATATARRLPVRTALSGPAAGVIAAARDRARGGLVERHHRRSRRHLLRRVADRGRPDRARGADHHRFRPRHPHADDRDHDDRRGRRLDRAASIKGGLLQVGPESAGSLPGPACYGARQHAPDAHRRQCGARPHQCGTPDRRQARAARRRGRDGGHPGACRRAARARRACARRKPSSRSPNARMAGAIRLVSIERGHDPATFAFMPFGGGGALHAGALMREVGLQSALVPRFPGVTSRARLRHRRPAPRPGADRQSRARRARRRGASIAAWSRPAARRAPSWRTRASPSSASTRSSSSTCITSARRTPCRCGCRWRSTASGTGRRGRRARRVRGAPIAAQFSRLLAGRARPHRDRCARPRSAAGRISISRRSRRCRAALETRGAARAASGSTVPGARPRSGRGSILPVGATIEGPAILEQPDATIFVDPGLVARGRRIRQPHRRAERGMNVRFPDPARLC